MSLVLHQILSLEILNKYKVQKVPVDADYHIGFEWLAVDKDVYVWVSVYEQNVPAPTTDDGVSIVGKAWRAL